jgi:hypothetical protein
MTDTIDLLNAIAEHSAALAEQRKAFAEADPYRWDYYGQPYRDRVDEAATKAATLLDSIIEKKVEERVARLRFYSREEGMP